MGNIYIVKYGTGSFDDYREVVLFATLKEYNAIIFTEKYNRLLPAIKRRYQNIRLRAGDFCFDSDDAELKIMNQCYEVDEITKAFYQKTELR